MNPVIFDIIYIQLNQLEKWKLLLSVDELIQRLLDEHDDWSETADEIIDELVAMGEPAIKPMIYQVLGNPDLDYPLDHTEAVAYALKQMGQPALTTLLETLNDPDPLVRAGSARALGVIGDKSALPALENALLKEQSFSALYALGQIGGDEAAQMLLKAMALGLFNPSSIISWLGETRSPTVIQPVIDFADHSDAEVRRSVAEALGNFDDPLARDVLIHLLEDEDQGVQYRVAHILATRFHYAGAAHVIVRQLEHKSEATRASTIAWIVQSGNQDYIERINELFKTDPARLVRLSAANALIEISYNDVDEAKRFVETALFSDDVMSRYDAVRSLYGMRHQFVETWLLYRIKDTDAYIRYFVADTLRQLPKLDSLDPIYDWKKTEEHRLVKKAIEKIINQHRKP